ncbi:hypothetical protein [Granulicatella sp. zg-ZJ]|uniref:hypothetical protein n=1 Tax=Granulicatella sp. zg-ZJ TaxID=2678504 RepID=UPI0013D64D6E|nr:hypothetical protein [Granulicatella sp. zg-ZJ]
MKVKKVVNGISHSPPQTVDKLKCRQSFFVSDVKLYGLPRCTRYIARSLLRVRTKPFVP